MFTSLWTLCGVRCGVESKGRDAEVEYTRGLTGWKAQRIGLQRVISDGTYYGVRTTCIETCSSIQLSGGGASMMDVLDKHQIGNGVGINGEAKKPRRIFGRGGGKETPELPRAHY